ncbi:hypothetical protein D2A34_04605 [Clostridium chromiireducens]|uniref:Uncharacterized protein n=1 Tax=Clostridium chromiireducens TaxID=225345 RepID=A0A399IUD9_9CLOT|nr:hypothetical protein [Clostridium chromiireducens]RII36671.1 hypothetical protein D2A34_04605 [Clostridium chromiireducens]
MSKDKAPYAPTPGDYDTNKLTDIHSSESEPSSYARNIGGGANGPRSKSSYNSSDRSIKKEQKSDITERIPTIIKYSNVVNHDSDEHEYQGEY